jgi:2'-5' RNA ligase
VQLRFRTFLACGVDAGSALRLRRALKPYRRAFSDPPFRWIEPVNYHVTLRFFGDLTRAEIDRADRIIAPIATTVEPIDCLAETPAPLPSARWPTVIALPLESNGRLEALAARFNDAFGPGFGAPDKAFKAHLTVIRCRRGARFVEPASFEYSLRFASIALFESSQADVGVRYAVLRKYALQG